MDQRTTERAQELLEEALQTMARDLDLAPADAGRSLLGALARWFGVDFRREQPADVAKRGDA